MTAVATAVVVDVVILTWNDGDQLDEAVSSALVSEGVDVKVIVVDNGSEPPARVVADPRVLLVRNECNRGVAAGRNQGARLGSGSLICFLDSDARLEPTCLRRLVDRVTHDGVALAAPVFTNQAPGASAGHAPTLGRKLARALNHTDAYDTAADLSRPWWDVDFAIGACQLVRRNAYEAVGGLDESYFYGPEDVDFCLRLRKAGWRALQVRDAACEHPARRRFRGLFTRRGLQHAVAVLRHLWRHR